MYSKDFKKWPISYLEVTRLMDVLLGASMNIKFERTLCASKLVKQRCQKRLLKYQKKHPHDPAVAWHVERMDWCPQDKESMKHFVELLLKMAQEDPVRGVTKSAKAFARNHGHCSTKATMRDAGAVAALTTTSTMRPARAAATKEVLPDNFREVLRFMTATFDNGVDYELELCNKTTRNHLARVLKREPGNTALNWHLAGREWAPTTKKNLGRFMRFLKNYHAPGNNTAKSDELSDSEPELEQKKSALTNAYGAGPDSFHILVPDDESVPKSYREVLELMDRLYGEQEGFCFEKEFFDAKTRQFLLDRHRKDPDSPFLSWRSGQGVWAPPDKESLELFCQFLLELSRRREIDERGRMKYNM